ncbi:hypothetical protein [Sphaerisporangium aureirubrum]|uniref:Uncharacterized protein n=1 Tax=Sphaerisporangium aureirubrum TaxID=1544736 RepID=A0ABW1NUN6_9ACTN
MYNTLYAVVHPVILGFLVVAVGIFLCLAVILPAVWSRKPQRRKAALDVLRLLLRWRRP